MEIYTNTIVEDNKYKYYSLRWGNKKEKVIKFIYDLKEVYTDKKYPVKVLNMGITYPDNSYKVCRVNSRVFVIEYILSGKGYLLINGKKFVVKAGDTYLIERGTHHTYFPDKNNPFKKIWINFYSYSYGAFLESLNLNGIYYFPNINIEDEFYKLFKLENLSPYSNDISFEAYNIILQLTLKLKKTIITNERTDIPQFIKKIKNLLDNVDNPKTIEEISKELNVSRPTIINKFKQYYKLTPNQYRIKQKINSACILLINSNKKIYEISNRLGFPDAYSFSHAFKKSTGMSPIEYRIYHSEPPVDY